MKQVAPALLLAFCAAASAQTAPARPAMPSTQAAPAAAGSADTLPAVQGVIQTMFSLRYEDYQVGTGPLAEPNKLYHVLYTGYLASTGQKFDSTDDHRRPVIKDGKPVMGPDGKPELGPPEPLIFPQGFGRLIPGFDQGFAGMHVGGKRRIFIPWQLAYGTRDIPARGDHPGIPPRSDLIFDVELVDVTDMPTMPERPMNVPPHPGAPAQPAKPGVPAAPSTPPPSTPQSSTTPPQAK